MPWAVELRRINASPRSGLLRDELIRGECEDLPHCSGKGFKMWAPPRNGGVIRMVETSPITASMYRPSGAVEGKLTFWTQSGTEYEIKFKKIDAFSPNIEAGRKCLQPTMVISVGSRED